MQQKVVFFETEPDEKVYLLKKIAEQNVVFTQENLNESNAAEFKGFEVISTFISSDLSEKTLNRLTNLNMIATRSTGFDHIDLSECRRRGIVVANVPSYGEYTVAEHTFALILSLSRNIHKAYMRMKSTEQFTFEGLMGFDLKGKTLGVVGAGHIGMHVIKIARGFGMRVLAYDVQKSTLLADVLGYDYVTLDELLQNSDIISVHAPYNKHTHHLINQSNIHRIKKGALLINTARGRVIETEALLHALDLRILAGAGLDVLEGEKLVREEKEVLTRPFSAEEMTVLLANHLLMNRENVVITPHLAFYSKEAVQRILDTTVQNILAFLKNEPLNVVS